jgi:hypothetical protein
MLSLIPEPRVFPHTHEEWLAKAMKLERELTQKGITAVRVEVEPARCSTGRPRRSVLRTRRRVSAYALLLTQAGLCR